LSYPIRTDSGAKTVVCQDILYDNVEKSGVKLDNVILTNVSEYLPWLKRVLGNSALGKAYRERQAADPSLLKGKGIHQFQDLLKKYPAQPPKLVFNLIWTCAPVYGWNHRIS
jgi:long-chain acyl-CoA synthetase